MVTGVFRGERTGRTFGEGERMQSLCVFLRIGKGKTPVYAGRHPAKALARPELTLSLEPATSA